MSILGGIAAGLTGLGMVLGAIEEITKSDDDTKDDKVDKEELS